MKKSLFNYPLASNRPSLCSECLAPVGGLLLHLDNRWYGSCSVEHLEKIKQRLERGESLPYVAMLNDKAVSYAVTKTKDKYLDIAKNEGSFVLHEWERKHRLELFGKVVAEYLNYCSELAKNGLLDTIRREDD